VKLTRENVHLDSETMLYSISSTALSMTLQKYFSHLSLVVYFSPTPPIKLKLGLEIGGELLIANHLDEPFMMMGQSETLMS
jgi:hypothetical protein